MKVITRFAPSPTGYLHVGNARPAILNWLYARQHNGAFILRLDDTDINRSRDEYANAIMEDLKWLGLNWDVSFRQSDRLTRYREIKEHLIKSGRLYPCFESQEELEFKRKIQLSQGKPPIYDRSSLKFSQAQIDDYLKSGRNPHYRFLIEDKPIYWHDEIKGEIKYFGSHLSDPVVIREDGSFTYMLCSVIDDADYNISHIIRGEDHITNTAVQIQMFEAINAALPTFAHFSFINAKDEKISKRIGGFEIANLRNNLGLEAITIAAFFTLNGTSKPVTPISNLSELIKIFDIHTFSKSPTTYIQDELFNLNHKILINLSYEEIAPSLQVMNINITKEFWLAVRPNLKVLKEIKEWWQICFSPQKTVVTDPEYTKLAASLLPSMIDNQTWQNWTKEVSNVSGRKGKELYLPLRFALTGIESGPELSELLPLIGHDEIIKRLTI